MTKYIFHTAAADERWDVIAYKYYKNSYKIKPIIEANPHIPISTTIKEGTILKIPIEIKTNDNELLPIWKRNLRKSEALAELE